MDKTEREAIRARCEAAHRSPWQLSGFLTVTLNNGYLICDAECDEDAEFIAAARQDIPALLDALDEADSLYSDTLKMLESEMTNANVFAADVTRYQSLWKYEKQRADEAYNIINFMKNNINALSGKTKLDEAEAAIKNRDEIIDQYFNSVRSIEDDRDHWKARAEALERAIKEMRNSGNIVGTCNVSDKAAEKRREYNRNWYAANRDKVRENTHRYWERKALRGEAANAKV